MNLKPLLDFIRKLEARGKYDITYSKIPKSWYPGVPFTSMTIGKVISWQTTVINRGADSSATGGYQFLKKTLSSVYSAAGLTLNHQFSPENQDKMATVLIKQRGLDRYLSGRIGIEDFCNNLAREWASLPVVTDVIRRDKNRTWVVPKGSSYYSGDGLNKSLTNVDTFLSVVRQIDKDPPEVHAPTWDGSETTEKPGGGVGATLVIAGGAALAAAVKFACSIPLLNSLITSCGG